MTSKLKRVITAYEDQTESVADFGPHRLLVACIADRKIADRLEVERALRDHRTMKGSAKLLRVCREDAADITRGGQPVVAIFDNDEVRRLLKLRNDAPDGDVTASIRQGSTAPALVNPVLLEENLETLVRNIESSDPAIDPDLIRRALDKKLAARDVVFKAAAREANRHVRDLILVANPSLKKIIDVVTQLLLGKPP